MRTATPAGRTSRSADDIDALVDRPSTASRQLRARWREPRMVGGALLLLVAAALGAVLLTRTPDTVLVWRATHDLSAGAVATDLEPVAVDRALVDRRYARTVDDVSLPLRWPILAGELLPTSALGLERSDLRRITVPVDPRHAPVGVQPGDLVDVWVSPVGLDAGSAAAPRLVLERSVVDAVSEESVGLGGELAVVLSVPAAEVPAVVGATRSGALDLIAVPVESQGAAP